MGSVISCEGNEKMRCPDTKPGRGKREEEDRNEVRDTNPAWRRYRGGGAEAKRLGGITKEGG